MRRRMAYHMDAMHLSDQIEAERQQLLRDQQAAMQAQAANNQAQIRRVVRDDNDLPSARLSKPFMKLETVAPTPQAAPSLPGNGRPLALTSPTGSPPAGDGPAAPKRGRPVGWRKQK